VNLSGILVSAKTEHLANVVESLSALEGVEVHQVEESTGRVIVVQEAEGIRDEMAGLRLIKTLPNVMMAEMVYHYIADDNDVYEGIPPELAEEEQSEPCAVPAYLND
jgi:periplasmic nitrate reductase NapD